jgi:acetate kinase
MRGRQPGADANLRGASVISAPFSRVTVRIIPTDEEWMIAIHRILADPGGKHEAIEPPERGCEGASLARDLPDEEVDPGAVLYLLQQRGMTAREVEHLLYSESGLLGV